MDSHSVVPKAAVDKTFRQFDPDQGLFLPPSLDEWLPADHLVRFIADLVDEHLDLSRIHAAYTEGRGGPPYDPRLMVRILLYGYTTGMRSSRKLEAACIDVVAFRWLAAGSGPGLSGDRPVPQTPPLRVGAPVRSGVGVVPGRRAWSRLGRVALDGTKLRANASKRKAMSYARMSEKEKILAAEVSDAVGRG